MTYRTIEENPAFRAGKEHGKFIAKQITPTHTKKREFYMYENKVFINDGYVTFNIIELDRTAGKVTVNITETGHHSIDTFDLKDLDGWTYFEYGRPAPEKIYIDDFCEVAYMNIEIKNLRFNKPLNQPWEFKVDRTSPIGNPFYMASEAKRDEVCDKYQLYFDKQIETNREFRDYALKILNALKTYKKVALYCWCAPKRCHAETIKNWLQKQIKE